MVGEVVRHGREEGEVLEGEEGQHGAHAVRLHRRQTDFCNNKNFLTDDVIIL